MQSLEYVEVDEPFEEWHDVTLTAVLVEGEKAVDLSVKRADSNGLDEE